jgi:tryptophan-rich sensory protein
VSRPGAVCARRAVNGTVADMKNFMSGREPWYKFCSKDEILGPIWMAIIFGIAVALHYAWPSDHWLELLPAGIFWGTVIAAYWYMKIQLRKLIVEAKTDPTIREGLVGVLRETTVAIESSRWGIGALWPFGRKKPHTSS